jgi:hypothetical protein
VCLSPLPPFSLSLSSLLLVPTEDGALSFP